MITPSRLRTILAAAVLFSSAAFWSAAAGQEFDSGVTPFLNAYDLRALAYDGDRGFWIASNGGAVYYDITTGEWSLHPRRRVGGPISNDLNTVAVDGNGLVWVGSAGDGVSTYDPASNRWEFFEEFPDPRIRVIRSLGDGVFIGTEAGLALRFRPNRTDLCNEVSPGCIVPDFQVNDYASLDGALWVATPGGLGRFNGVAWDSVGALPDGSIGQNSLSLAVHDGELWEASDAGVRRLVGSEWTVTGISASRVVSSDGQFFAFTADSLWWWVEDDWIEIPLPGIGSIRDVAALGVVLYFATDAGLAIFNTASSAPIIHEVRVPPGPQIADFHRGIAATPDGILWAGNQEGLLRYDGAEWTYFPKGDDGLDREWIFNLRAVGDDLAIGHCCCNSPPRCRLDIRNSEGFSGVQAHDIWTMDVDSRGRIWAGTNDNGAYVLEPDGSGGWNVVLEITNAGTGGGLRSNDIAAIAVTADGTYFGHPGGVDFWEHGDQLPIGGDLSAQPWTSITVSNGLRDNSVSSMAAAGRDVYIGTSSGLHRLTSRIIFTAWATNFANDPGDLPRIVRSIVLDPSGGIWAGTNNGVLYRTLGSTDFRLFSTGNSDLTSDDVLSGGLNPADGSVWFGTALGITRFDPDKAVGSTSAPEFTIYPNPFRLAEGHVRTTLALRSRSGGASPAGEVVREAAVFDLTGRDVGIFINRGTEWQWDLRNRNGSFVVPGVYLVRVTTVTGVTRELKLAVLR